MRIFDFRTEYKKLLTPDIVNYLTQIHEFKGEHNPLMQENEKILTELLDIAKIQSTEASNRIEGIITTDDRLKLIVREKTMPKTRSEKEIAGYRDILSIIHQNYNYIPLQPNWILQLHKNLNKFNVRSIGGSYKNTDNVIAEDRIDGTRIIRFEPVPAWETPEAVSRLCEAMNEALNSGEMDPLILIPMFILDFLCIHPFGDGNGRMSRLLTLLLLYRSGYFVGKYISIEKLIADTKETYYEVLQDSSQGWHDGTNDYEPFVAYMLSVILAACREFSERTELLVKKGATKPDRIREIIRGHIGKITKAEIMAQCPDISQVTVQRALSDLLKTEEIIKIGGGRYTTYIWNGDKEL